MPRSEESIHGAASLARAAMIDPRDGTFTRAPAATPDRLDRVLRTFRPELSWSALRDLIERGKVSVGGAVVTDAGATIAGGVDVTIAVSRKTAGLVASPAALPAERLAFVDRHVVVVDKPAGIDTVPFEAKGGRDRRPSAASAGPTLDRLVAQALGGKVRVVHRLDRDTTGLLMFARSEQAETSLAQQLRRHTVHRRYLALVHGDAKAGTLRSFLVDDRGDGRRGATHNERIGKEAITHVEVVERLRGATLVACRLETGRTHQIRIHLAEAGHMLLGERPYTRDHAGEALPAPRILLHAAELGFAHPVTGEVMRFAVDLPADMAERIVELRP